MSSENKIAVTQENLFSKGFGIIPQAVMFDTTLSIKSKALYAYFCSYTGQGHHVFPSRNKILCDLNISKEVYYNAFKPLTATGYIKVGKAQGFLNKNVYVIENKPTSVNCVASQINNSEESTLSFEGINANGFGVIPKLVMCDSNLTITAKGLLAFFYSLAAQGACVFPKRSVILNSLGISLPTYYKALDLVIEKGYVKVNTRRSKNGRFAINNYILCEDPQPCTKNPDNGATEEISEISPCTKNPDNGVDRVQKNQTLPCTKNPDNNNIIFNNNSNISTSNLNVSTTTKVIHNDEIKKRIHKMTEYRKYEKLASECQKSDDRNIRSFAYVNQLYLKVVNIICELATQNKLIRIKDKTVSKQMFMDSLMSCAIENKLHCLVEEICYHYEILRNKYIIKNPREYLKPIIWQHIENFAFDTEWWKEDW